MRLRYYNPNLILSGADSVRYTLRCVICDLSHRTPSLPGGPFITIGPCDLRLWLSHHNLVILGADLWTSDFLDLWNVGPIAAFHLVLPHSLRVLPRHLLLPLVQVKLELWLALTSSYELEFKCCFHRWNQDDKNFDMKLILSRFFHFEFWAFLPCHWYFLEIHLDPPRSS